MRGNRCIDAKRHLTTIMCMSTTVVMVIVVFIRPIVVQNERHSDIFDVDDQYQILEHSVQTETNPYLDNPASWTPPVLPKRMRTTHQDDPALIKHIRNHWILPPSRRALSLAEPDLKDFSKFGQSSNLDKYLAHKEGGYFIEVGASKGEKVSKSLFFERQRGWSGLLVEPDPYMFRATLAKHRHSYTINTCIAPGKSPMWLNFTSWDVMSGLTDYLQNLDQYDISDLPVIPMQCFPFYSVMAALGTPYVDFVSINVEGTELEILQSIPFDRVSVDVFMIDVDLQSQEGKERTWNMVTLLSSHGYKRILPESTVDLTMSKL